MESEYALASASAVSFTTLLCSVVALLYAKHQNSLKR